jgi:2-polyprenyl-3-methyl-5-hydroxy-6-metoxy-1,4-benzoquinol methylase
MAEPSLRQLMVDAERMAAAVELAASRRAEVHTPFEKAFSVLEQVLEGARSSRDETVKSLAAAFGSMTRALGSMLDRTEHELQALRTTVARLESRLDGTAQLTDGLYSGFEERFRGDYHDVLRRHEVYLPWLDELKARHPGACAFEIGPGRGEMARLLTDHGFRWRGVESNAQQTDKLVSKGFDATTGDAWAALAEQPEGSLGLIVALHVIEHVPFERVIELFELARTRLVKGGLVVLETPNWRSLTSAQNFFLDPTHLRPVDGRLLEFTAQHHGFDVLLCEGVEPAAQLERLPDGAAHAAAFNRNLERLETLLYPGQDLAFVARLA